MVHSLFDQLFRDMANAPRIAREITERTARECGVCHHCGRDLKKGPCRSLTCPLARQPAATNKE